MSPDELEELRAHRYWSWWVWEGRARELMAMLDTDPNVDLQGHGVLLNAAWEAACRADQKFWQGKREMEES